MREADVEAEPESYPGRVPLLGGFEDLLQPRLARAEEDELGVQGQDGIQALGDEVDPFLRGQTRDHRQDGSLGPLGQAEGPLEIRLADRLAGRIVSGEAARDDRVVARVPLLVVDPVQDTGDVAAARPQDPFEAVAELLGLDFLLTVLIRSLQTRPAFRKLTFL